MSETLCTLRTKGGGSGKYTETSLWTNSAPTSDFGAQTVTLSDSIDNYKYIKIKYSFSTSYNTGNYLSNYIISVDEFKKSPYPEASGTARLNYSFARMNTSNVAGYRRFYYASSTTVRFGSTDTNALIPLEILGLNELDHGKRFDETTLWTNASPTSAFAAQVVTLSDDIDNYDYLKVNYRHSTSNAIVCAALISPSDMKKSMYDLGNNRMEVTLGSEATYFRRMTYASDTSISFSTAYKIGATGSSTSYSIPLSVVGCKFR